MGRRRYHLESRDHQLRRSGRRPVTRSSGLGGGQADTAEVDRHLDARGRRGRVLAAAAGLLVGPALPPLAVAAAAGVFLYCCGAVVFRVRAHDRRGMIAPTALAVTAPAANLPAVQNA
ncbi:MULTISPECIES: DoxX family protein [Streptomyces]|uniref:DoxX family protein n=1 Tax=Streptomyces TaxID=1883 RepID=UPI002E1966F2